MMRVVACLLSPAKEAKTFHNREAFPEAISYAFPACPARDISASAPCAFNGPHLEGESEIECDFWRVAFVQFDLGRKIVECNAVN